MGPLAARFVRATPLNGLDKQTADTIVALSGGARSAGFCAATVAAATATTRSSAFEIACTVVGLVAGYFVARSLRIRCRVLQFE